MGNKGINLTFTSILKKFGRVVAATVLVAAIFVTNQTHAQNSVANGFRISPVRSELTIDKGTKQKITITVENPTNIATIARLFVHDFVASDDESGEPRLILDNSVPAPKN